MTDTLQIKIELLGYWHAGSGISAGTRVDAMIVRDAQGLPYFPGRTLKGLLRDAVHQAVTWGWFTDDFSGFTLDALLFGTRGDAETAERGDVEPGMLLVSDARLSGEERAYLDSKEGQKLQSLLVKEVFSTAIDYKGPRSGVATEQSLRGQEVTIPMTLSAPLAIHLPVMATAEFSSAQAALLASGKVPEFLRRVLPLIESIGSSRHRGYGRAELTLQGAN
jgi:hypothetical protein